MSVQISNMTDTWNDSAVVYNGIKMNVTDINSSANSTLISIVINDSERFVVDKTGTIVSGQISANNVLGFIDFSDTVLAQVEEAKDLAALYGSARIYETWTDLYAVTGNANSAAIITSESGTHTDPVNANTVNNSGLYIWKNSSPGTGWKWIDNTLAFNAYESALVATAQANVAVSAAIVASASVSLIQTLALTQQLYYSTFAAAVAATDVGGMFTCDEGGTWAYYIRTGVSPFYELHSFVITEDYINSNIVGGANVYENWLSLGSTSAANGTVGVVLNNDAGNHTDPITSTSVSNSGVFIRFPAGWKRIANTEAYDAKTSAASANASMNTALAAATTSVAVANAVSFTYDAIQNLVLTELNYYPFIANGIAATANGQLFSSDETGVWTFYKKLPDSPFYEYFSAISIPGGNQAIYDFTAANNQTTFTIDLNPDGLSTEVFVNGLRLQSSDFNVTGNTVVVDTPRANNDSVSIVISGSTTGSFSGAAVTYNANASYANGSIAKAVKDLQVGGAATTIAGVTGLQAALNAKANTSHTHVISAVDGLDTALNLKANTAFVNGSGANTISFSHANAYSFGTLGSHNKAFVVASDAPFNVRGDDSTDNAAGINAALAHCHSLGGGDVFLPGGRIRHSATIDIKYPRVNLVGRGFDYAHDSGTAFATRTVLVPTFAGTAVKLRTPYAAEQAVTAANTHKYWGGGIRDLSIDCNNTATKALEIDSVSGVNVRVYATGCVGTTCFEIKTGVSGTDLGEACDVQHSLIWVAARLIDTTAQKACHICTLSGSINANVSLNRGPLSGIFVGGQHWDGHAVLGGCADNNDIAIAAYRAGGSGRPLYAKGPTAAIPVGFDSNTIRYLASAGTAYAEGTDTGGVTGGTLNTIEHLDRGNGTPTPTAGTGSYWEFHGTDGVDVGKSFNKLIVADSDPNAKTERANLSNTSLLIRNGSSAHIILTDGTNKWSVALDGADFRIAQLAGSGAINIGNGSPVKIGGKLVSEGAADSGGTGYKVLRVPN